jgi:hypothetical protein
MCVSKSQPGPNVQINRCLVPILFALINIITQSFFKTLKYTLFIVNFAYTLLQHYMHDHCQLCTLDSVN